MPDCQLMTKGKQSTEFTTDFLLTPFRQAALHLNEKPSWEQVRYAYSVAHEASSVLPQSKKFSNWSHEVSLAIHSSLDLWNMLSYFFCYIETELFILLPYLHTCTQNRSKDDSKLRQA